MKKTLLLSLLFIGIVYVLALNPKIIGEGIDDGVYILIGKKLTEGKLMKTNFPILYPLILGGIWKIYPKFPQNIPLLKSISIITALISIYFIYIFFIKISDRSSSCIIAILTGITPGVVNFSTTTMAEIPYSLFSIISIFYIMNYDENMNKKNLILGILFSVLAFFTRTIGLTLIIALCLHFLVKYKFNKKILLIEIVGVSLILWVSITMGASGYIDQFFQKDIERPYLGRITFSDLISRSGSNWVSLFTYGISNTIFPFANSLFLYKNVPFLYYFLQVIASLLIIVGFIISFKRRFFLHLYLIIYTLLVIMWNWVPTRFIIPIAPFLFYFLFLAIKTMFKRKLILYIVTLVLGISCMARNVDSFYFLHKNGEWDKKMEIFNWIRNNTKENSIIMTLNSSQLNLYTNRKSVGIPIPPYEKELNADYITVSPRESIAYERFNLLVEHFKDKYNFNLVSDYIYKVTSKEW